MGSSANRSRYISRWVLLAFLICLMPAGVLRAQGVVFQEVEPNETLAEANKLPLNNLVVRGEMDFKGDVDVFEISLLEGNLVRIFATGIVGAFDGRIQILNENGDILAEEVRVFPATTLVVTANITAATPPGVGYVRFTNDLFDPFDNNTFVYNAQFSQGLPEVEPNDTPAQAQPLPDDLPLLGTYPAQVNITDDFSKFTTTAPDQTVALVLEYATSTNVDLRMELQDEEGEVLVAIDRTNISGTGGIKNPSIVFLLPEVGTYFVRIYNPGAVPGGQFTVNYSLFITVRDGLYEQEPNQSFQEAVRVNVPPGEPGVVIKGFLQAGLDTDLYMVQVPAGFSLVSDVDNTSVVEVMDGVTSAFLEEDDGYSFASSDNSSMVPAGASFALINFDPYLRVVPSRGGSVIVGVADRNNFGGPRGFSYDLNLKVIPAPGGESEPNDQVGSERRLESGETVRGTIGVTGDVDRFIIAGLAGETMLVNLNGFGIGSFLDARAIIRDSQENILVDQSVSSFSPDPFILIPALPADDDYIIQVQSRQGVPAAGASYYYEMSTNLSTSIQTIVADPDVDGSGRVDGFDLAIVARIFGSSTGDPDFLVAADLIRDGTVDGLDLAALGNFFGNEVDFAGTANLLVDTRGDDLPFFGPATNTSDFLGLGTELDSGLLTFSVFYRESVTANTGGVISVDTDASGLTGSLGTPDAYVAEQSLGSELELFFDSNSVELFSIPDPRGDIYPAFRANLGDVDTPSLPPSAAQRAPLEPLSLGTTTASSAGNRISFDVNIDTLGGSALANAAALALSVGDVEPTDRLPDEGKVSLQPLFVPQSIIVSQRVCDDDRRQLCTVDDDCVTTCVDVDSLLPDSAGGAPIPPGRTQIYLRTQDGPPVYRDWERSVPPSLFNGDPGGGGSNGQHNDTLNRLFPFGTVGQAGTDTRFEWFTRDLLYNFSYRDSSFDPHAVPNGLQPPDVDLYYFLGGEGDRAILDVTTADQGGTFDSQLELFRIPLSPSALDPTEPASQLAVADSDLILVASNDDKSPTDRDPRLEIILSNTSLYVVRVSASPNQTVFPGTTTDYSIYHESLRPDEFSVPIIARGQFFGTGLTRVSGLNLHLDFDPAVISMTGIDLAQGTRSKILVTDRNPSMAQEYVAERLVDDPGRVRMAIRSFRDTSFTLVNGLQADGLQLASCRTCPEIIIVRLRFRAVGPGSTTIEIAPNPTVTGEPLLNLGLGEQQDGPIWQPFFGYGPGIQVTVAPPAP